MDVGLPLVQAIYAISAAAGLALGYVVWQHREKTGARPLLASIVGGWWWSTALFLATVTSSFTVSVWLERALYVGVVLVVAGVFLFALEYTGREHLVTWRLVALLSIQPILVVAFVFTNPGDLFFASLSPDPAKATGVAIEWNLAFWVHSAYSYALILAGIVLVVRMLFRTRSIYRRQIVVATLAVLSPPLANIGWIAGPISFDSTPVGFVAWNALFTLAVTRYRFIEITPIAHDRVIDTISDAVFVVDREHRFVEVNPAGRSMVRELAGEDAIVGRDVTELLAWDPDAQALYHELVSGNTERTTAFSTAGQHFDVTATPVTDGGDRVHGWLFLVSDVTERRHRERELRRRNEQLDQFASVVSHDLRNPIAVADGYAALARETGDLSHLDDVTAALERMDAIVGDVLALARARGGAIDPKGVDLRSIATEAWGNVETGDAAALRVADTATVRADRDRLVRLFENLFRNAIEHGTTPVNGGEDDARPVLQVEVGVVPADGESTIGFYVADDGPGIPEDERERVFEMGYTTSADGTGFGLNIVSQIVDVHDWAVRMAESDAGGARIVITGVEPADSRARVRRTGA